MLTTTEKREIVGQFQRKELDTGSSEVQIALLSERIRRATEHVKVHTSDHHSRRGLLLLVGQRRALLGYLKREDEERHRDLVERLGIRG